MEVIVMEVIVLNVKPFDFMSKETGERLQGCNINYLCKGDKGKYEIMKLNVGFENEVDFPTLPGKYSLEFDVMPGIGNKPRIVYKSAKFIEKITLNL